MSTPPDRPAQPAHRCLRPPIQHLPAPRRPWTDHPTGVSRIAASRGNHAVSDVLSPDTPLTPNRDRDEVAVVRAEPMNGPRFRRRSFRPATADVAVREPGGTADMLPSPTTTPSAPCTAESTPGRTGWSKALRRTGTAKPRRNNRNSRYKDPYDQHRAASMPQSGRCRLSPAPGFAETPQTVDQHPA